MRPPNDALTPRRACILGAIVEEYVRTAVPVGSKTVQERQELGVSTATIRNEMLALERYGYIRQPHTSAGRVPADMGYRAYVDRIMEPRPARAEEIAWIRSEYRRTAHDPESLYRTTTRVLSRLTSAPALVMAPPDKRQVIVRLSLTPVSATIVLLSYETEPGERHERLLMSERPLTASQVSSLSNALQQRYGGRAIGALSSCTAELLEDETVPFAVPQELLDQIKDAIENSQEQRVYVDGAAFSLDYPEYRELSQLRPLMEALDEEPVVRRALRPAARRGGVTVTIGQEQPIKELRHCALVARAYRGLCSHDVGVAAILGPTRLDYRAAIAAVSAVADSISHALEEAAERHGEAAS